MTVWDMFLFTRYWYTPGSVLKTIKISQRYLGKQAIDAKEQFYVRVCA